jgi:tRNA U34 5-methylaminomethyl-2-thiouridine-forming methyltransferase MnmC
MNTELLITSDGSHSLFVPEIDECYHSTYGAVQESRHIFIDAGLRQCHKTEIYVLEIGFGTGLNAFLALLEAERSEKKINYISLELFPVEINKALQLNYPDILAPDNRKVFRQMHTCAWNEEIQVTPFFGLNKIKTDFLEFVFKNNFDVVFFDAFSPDKQPEMWSNKQFEKIYAHCNPGAILTTYCAKGIVRRTMQSAGFEVERIPGPPGKREMLRGVKSLKV